MDPSYNEEPKPAEPSTPMVGLSPGATAKPEALQLEWKESTHEKFKGYIIMCIYTYIYIYILICIYTFLIVIRCYYVLLYLLYYYIVLHLIYNYCMY